MAIDRRKISDWSHSILKPQNAEVNSAAGEPTLTNSNEEIEPLSN